MTFGITAFEALLEREDFPVSSTAGQKIAKVAALRYFRALVAKDIDALAESVTDDIVYEMPLSESGAIEPVIIRRYAGKEAFIEFWTATFPGFPKRLEPDDVEVSISSDGSHLFLEQRGNFIVADGRSYRNMYLFRLTISGGKVSYVREYFNPIILAQAMGLPIAHTFYSKSP